MISGGWELAYDYLMHITGEKEAFSGVGMFVGHYRSAMEAKIQSRNPGVAGFFSENNWRVFIHSALALRMASLPERTRGPCCDMELLGGDGTGIGVPLASAQHITPAWAPLADDQSQTQSPLKCLDRCAIGYNNSSSTASEIAGARKFMKELTSRSISVAEIGTLRDNIDDHKPHMPAPVACALEMFLIMNGTEPHWHEIRSFLNSLAYTDSLSTIITLDMVSHVKQAVDLLRTSQPPSKFTDLSARLSEQGMGPCIAKVIEAELVLMDSTRGPRRSGISTAITGLLEYIGSFVIFLYHVSCTFISICFFLFVLGCSRTG